MSWKRVGKGPRGNGPTPQQRLYITAYLETLDGKLSAELAGYSKKSAVDISKGLQRKPAVRAAIEKGLKEKERELKDRCIKAMEHAYAQATADIAELFDEEGAPLPLSKMPREVRRAIHSVEVEFEWCEGKRIPRLAKIKLHDKRASQELFAKYAGKLKDKIELDATKSYAEMVLAAQRKREGSTEPAAPEPEP